MSERSNRQVVVVSGGERRDRGGCRSAGVSPWAGEQQGRHEVGEARPQVTTQSPHTQERKCTQAPVCGCFFLQVGFPINAIKSPQELLNVQRSREVSAHRQVSGLHSSKSLTYRVHSCILKGKHAPAYLRCSLRANLLHKESQSNLMKLRGSKTKDNSNKLWLNAAQLDNIQQNASDAETSEAFFLNLKSV